MEGPWVVAFAALWSIVLIEAVLIFVLYHQLGVMYLGTAEAAWRDGLSVGTIAPDFTAADERNRAVRLSSLLGKRTLLVFGVTECRLCENVVPELNSFAAEQNGNMNVLFLVESRSEDAAALATRYSVTIPLWTVRTDEVAKQYRVRVTPFGFLIDEKGMVRSKGLVNHRDHVNALLELAARNDPAKRSGGTNELPR